MFLKFDDLARAAVIFYMYVHVSYSQFPAYMYYMYMWFPVLYLTNLISNPLIKDFSMDTSFNSLMHLHILEQDPDSNTKSSIAMSLR